MTSSPGDGAGPIATLRIGRDSILDLLFSGVLLAVGLLFLANLILKVPGWLSAFVGGALVLVGIAALIVLRTGSGRIRREVNGYLAVNDLSGEVVRTDRYPFGKYCADTLGFTFRNSSTAAFDWLSPRTTKSVPPTPDHSGTLRMIGESALLTYMSRDLADFFPKPEGSKRAPLVSEWNRDNLADIVGSNPALDLTTKLPRVGGVPEGMTLEAVVDGNVVIERLHVRLPGGSTIQRTTDGLRIKNRSVDLRVAISGGAGNYFEPALMVYGLGIDGDDARNTSLMTVTYRFDIRVSRLLLIRSSASEYQAWIDHFLSGFGQYCDVTDIEQSPVWRIADLLMPLSPQRHQSAWEGWEAFFQLPLPLEGGVPRSIGSVVAGAIAGIAEDEFSAKALVQALTELKLDDAATVIDHVVAAPKRFGSSEREDQLRRDTQLGTNDFQLTLARELLTQRLVLERRVNESAAPGATVTPTED